MQTYFEIRPGSPYFLAVYLFFHRPCTSYKAMFFIQIGCYNIIDAYLHGSLQYDWCTIFKYFFFIVISDLEILLTRQRETEFQLSLKYYYCSMYLSYPSFLYLSLRFLPSFLTLSPLFSFLYFNPSFVFDIVS